MVISVFATLITLIDALELLRKAASKQIPIFVIFNMVLLKLPIIIQTILPFIVLVSAVLAYTTLARRSELVVIRAAGVSVWEFLTPSLLSAFLIGIFFMIVVNPVSSVMLIKYQELNAKYFENKQFIDVSDSGFWVKQQYDILPQKKDEENNSKIDLVVHAENLKSLDNKVILNNFEIYAFDSKDIFLFRIDSEEVEMIDNKWIIKKPKITYRNNKSVTLDLYTLDSPLKENDIQNSFADPQAISFFKLPAFIKKLEESGFSAMQHILQWHKLLSAPFFYVGMVLVGAIFSLKAPRQGAIGFSISLSIVFGFIIYFLSNLVSSFGISGSIPVLVSAWTPVLITILIGTGLLLHYEDG
jgi:lipopolysaccharide export system permease protein